MKREKLFYSVIVLIILVIIFIIILATEKQNSKSPIKSSSLGQPVDKQNKPLVDLLSPENIIHERKSQKKKEAYKVEDIQSETKSKKAKRRTFLRPEDRGERFSGYSADKLLNKLQTGNKIEQRKASIELWNQYGIGKKALSLKQQQFLNNEVSRYLKMTKSNFEEGYLQLQRLWFLATQGLFNNLTNNDNKISEMSARMLSLMKTGKIIDQLIEDAQKAKTSKEIKKYIFALKYMQYNNPSVIKRQQISKTKAEKFYKEKVAKVINQLEMDKK
jgi:hypothetical protein